MSEAKALATVDTEYTADSIEFCPHAGYEKYFTCGTYQVIPVTKQTKSEANKTSENGAGGKLSNGTAENGANGASTDGKADGDGDSDDDEATPPAPRVGRLYLFSLEGDQPIEVQRTETAAILDVKWSPVSPSLSVADAKGAITEFDFADGKLAQKSKVQVTDESRLVLSLDYARDGRGLISSLSSGSLAHLVADPSGWRVSEEWHAHDFEPWIAAYGDEHTVWSGGDDCRLKRWDLRAPQMATFINKRFDAGVTTIAPSPYAEHVLAVGSYDSNLRIFDARSPGLPLLEMELPGGIWRTRWHPSAERKGDILNACMHGGFAVVRLPGALAGGELCRRDDQGDIIATFPGTLGYGADWSRRSDGDDTSTVATCSFYDHVMNVWRA